MKKFILVSVLFSCIHFAIKAQDVSFLNNNQSLLLLNPSFAGSNENVRIQTSHKNQYPNLNYNFKTFYTGVDWHIKKINGAVAITVLKDVFSRGLLTDSRMGIVYAQNIKLANKKLILTPAIEINYIQRSLDSKSLTFGDIIDGRYGTIFNNQNLRFKSENNKVDLSTGFLMSFNNFYAGLAIKHIIQPDIGLFGVNKLPISINVHASYSKSITPKSFIQFFTLFNHQGSFNTLSLNANAVFMKHLMIGLGHCSNSQTSMSLGYRNNYLSCVLSLDRDFNKLRKRWNNSTNLALCFRLSKSEQKKWIEGFEKW